MTKIIATIGPSSEKLEILEFFAKNKVKIARFNFSHGTIDWHTKIGKLAQEAGLEIMLDLAGPKILVGNLDEVLEVSSGQLIAIEAENQEKKYPQKYNYQGKNIDLISSNIEIANFLETNKLLLIDDGKVVTKVIDIEDKTVILETFNKGIIKSNKGVNLPESRVEMDFLVPRDKEFLNQILPILKPDYIAPSFVKKLHDLESLNEFIKEVLLTAGIDLETYFPKICTKIEMAEAITNITEIVKYSDMIMVARGDMALETLPLHIQVPFLQEKIIKTCKNQNKEFIVATQILESMFSSPVPLRSELSDLYRAVIIDKANYVMLSGETAAGQYPKKCVQLMSEFIDLASNL